VSSYDAVLLSKLFYTCQPNKKSSSLNRNKVPSRDEDSKIPRGTTLISRKIGTLIGLFFLREPAAGFYLSPRYGAFFDPQPPERVQKLSIRRARTIPRSLMDESLPTTLLHWSRCFNFQCCYYTPSPRMLSMAGADNAVFLFSIASSRRGRISSSGNPYVSKSPSVRAERRPETGSAA